MSGAFKVAVVILSIALAQAWAAPSKSNISPGLLRSLETQQTADILISMHPKTSSVLHQLKVQSFPDRTSRLNSVVTSLKALAQSSQKPILSYLGTRDLEVRSFWINNKISVKGADARLVQRLSTIEGVAYIRAEKVYLADPLPSPSPTNVKVTPASVQWGVEMVEAPAAWAQGFTGRGVVVGILDTGVRQTHSTLRKRFREERGWLDVTGYDSLTPRDPNGHGTHVAGIIVGSDGVGVAPDAEWIACGGNIASDDTEYIRCGEFFLCPTHANGTEPDCAAAPHIISNSWNYTPPDEDDDFLDEIIATWTAAGIFVTWSNSNWGTCSSTGYPGNTAFDIFAVGATDSLDRLAEFSSHGPARWTGAIKPNIVAPGVGILSASNQDDESLVSMSGTSMASPNMAGVIALLLSNGTELTYGDLSSFLYTSATHTVPPTGLNCGGIPETQYPNNAVGHGRVTAAGAIQKLLERRHQKHRNSV